MPPGMRSKVMHPIALHEFASVMSSIQPPSGWAGSVAVANSGGPDSTCLLFLLDKYFRDPELAPKEAPNVVSITIDHDLQESSRHMADEAEQSARTLGIRHVTSRIPWGEEGFPLRPGPGDAIEERARNARYDLLYKSMNEFGANTVAFGHHADDQVETMLMRLGKNSTILGLAGMSTLARRGMGKDDNEETSIRWNGFQRLNTWKIRPLLWAPKDRILATCEANGLDYVTDPTNFQPALTIRNAIRDAVANAVVLGDDTQCSSLTKYPLHLAEQLVSINTSARKHPSLNMYLHSGKEKLYTSLKEVTLRAEAVNREVDETLEKKRHHSPPGTVLLPYPTFRDIPNPLTRRALVWRIMKYVSPSPWGSLRSEGQRREDSMRRLLDILCDNKIHERQPSVSLTVGSRVLWRLVRLKPDGYSVNIASRPPEQLAWLASRASQYKDWALPDPLNVDITPQLKSTYREWRYNQGPPILRFVYDCRFLLTFDVSKFPVEELLRTGNVWVAPRTEWHLPQVVLRAAHSEETTPLHNYIKEDPYSWTQQWNSKKRLALIHKFDGVTTEYFRPISYV